LQRFHAHCLSRSIFSTILLRAVIDENRAAASYGRSRLLEIDAYESATKFAPVAPLLTLSRTGIVAPRTDEGGGAYKRWDGKANYFAAAGDHMIAMWGILQSWPSSLRD
jgi:hypothetical protein